MNLLHTCTLHNFYKNSLKDLNLFLDELDVAQFIKSTKGHAQLVDKAGNIYNRHKTNSSQTVIYWRCTQHKKSTCFGRVQTQGFFITKYVNKHSHPPPEEQFQSPVWDFAKQLFSNFTFIWINFYLTYTTPLQNSAPWIFFLPLINTILNLFADTKFEVAKFTTSQYGNPQLVDTNGFVYRRHKSSAKDDKTFWICTKRDSLKCKARATTSNAIASKGLQIISTGDHNHASQYEYSWK